MDMPTVLGAPRHCKVGNNIYWVRPMTMRDLASIMQWLDDVLPGRAERKMPPKIGDEASQNALRSFPGMVMMTSLALAPHGFSYAQAAELVPHSPEDDENGDKWLEHVRLIEVYRARRRTMGKGEGGEDWSETWLDQNAARFAFEYGLEEVGNLTLDQYEWLVSNGKADEFGQHDLASVQAGLPDRIAAIQAAIANGTMEAPPSTL